MIPSDVLLMEADDLQKKILVIAKVYSGSKDQARRELAPELVKASTSIRNRKYAEAGPAVDRMLSKYCQVCLALHDQKDPDLASIVKQKIEIGNLFFQRWCLSQLPK